MTIVKIDYYKNKTLHSPNYVEDKSVPFNHFILKYSFINPSMFPSITPDTSEVS